MKIKTSVYIDEGIDRKLDERAKASDVSKSKTLETDLENHYLCLDLGLQEAKRTLTDPQMRSILFALKCTPASKKDLVMFVNFGIDATRLGIPEDAADALRRLSPLARFALADTTNWSIS